MPYIACPECHEPMEVDFVSKGACLVLRGIHCGVDHEFGPYEGHETPEEATAAAEAARRAEPGRKN